MLHVGVNMQAAIMSHTRTCVTGRGIRRRASACSYRANLRVRRKGAEVVAGARATQGPGESFRVWARCPGESYESDARALPPLLAWRIIARGRLFLYRGCSDDCLDRRPVKAVRTRMRCSRTHVVWIQVLYSYSCRLVEQLLVGAHVHRLGTCMVRVGPDGLGTRVGPES